MKLIILCLVLSFKHGAESSLDVKDCVVKFTQIAECVRNVTICDQYMQFNREDIYKLLGQAVEDGYIKTGRNDHFSCWIDYTACPMTLEETREIIMHMMSQDMLAIPEKGTQRYNRFIYNIASM